MATLKFILKGKSIQNTIYARFIDGKYIDITVSTGYTILKKYWSTSKNNILPNAEFKGKLELDNFLLKFNSLIFEKRNSAIAAGIEINKTWLIQVINESRGFIENKTETTLTHLFDEYKKKLPNAIRNNKKGVAPGTLRNYNTTKSRIERYEEFLGKELQVSEIGFDFHEKYIEFATNVMQLAPNSIGKDIRQIKTVLTDAKDNGIYINEQALSRKFNSPSQKTLFTTLSKSEIEELMKFDGTESLNNARNWLVIGCWTGCRIGDLMKLSMDNIQIANNRKIIRYTQSKTGKTVSVPIHPHVEQIITKNNSFPRPISDVNFNLYIKKLCKEAGFTQLIYGTRQNPKTHKKETGMFEKHELIRSHICRRSFATNHYNELPNKLIMAVTGHATEKMLLNYIGVTEEDHINDFLELWNIK